MFPWVRAGLIQHPLGTVCGCCSVFTNRASRTSAANDGHGDGAGRLHVFGWGADEVVTENCLTLGGLVAGSNRVALAPRRVRVPRVMGEVIEMWGYAPETIIAEKGVTILERGIASTRWRDYVDIVRLANTQQVDPNELRRSAEAVAQHRDVDLLP